MRIPSGVTDQYVYFVAVDATDFTTRETGLSSFTVYRSRNGGASAAMTTPTVNETDSTNMPGVYELLLDEDMTIDSGDDEQEMVFHITHAGMAPVTRAITLFRPKITAGQTVTASSGSANSAVQSIAANAITASSIASNALTAAKIATDAITAAKIATDAIGASELAADAVAEIRATVDAALVAVHLDHLLAADYDPASKPGVSTALLNELIESDGGVSRFTTNALEQGPSGSGASAETIADAVWDEAKAGHVGAGSFGEEVQAHALSSEVSALNDLSAAAVNAEVDTALADYDAPTKAELDSGLAALNDLSAAAVNAEVDTALADYDAPTKAELDAGLAALNDLSAAEVNAQVDAAFTTQMADSVATDGSIPTREQALLMVSRFLFERSVSSTTVTVTKEDGSTSSMTFALDDASNPTSITRSA